MSKAIKSIGSALGFGGDDEVRRAGRDQIAASNSQIQYLQDAEQRSRADLAPFRQMGLDAMPGFQGLLSSQGQFDFLQSNPMFQAAIGNANNAINTNASATGKLNSGGTIDQLFQNYLATGDNFVNSQFNRLLSPVNIGQSAAAGSANMSNNFANQIGGAIGGQGDINAASRLGQQNARGAMGNNLLALGAMAFSDPKVKTNVVKVGRDEYGNIYEFDYIWGGRYRGRMADELREIRPDAVVELDGSLLVSDEFAPVKVKDAA